MPLPYGDLRQVTCLTLPRLLCLRDDTRSSQTAYEGCVNTCWGLSAMPGKARALKECQPLSSAKAASMCLSICPSMGLSVCPSAHLSFRPPLSPSVCLSFIHPSFEEELSPSPACIPGPLRAGHWGSEMKKQHQTQLKRTAVGSGSSCVCPIRTLSGTL